MEIHLNLTKCIKEQREKEKRIDIENSKRMGITREEYEKRKIK